MLYVSAGFVSNSDGANRAVAAQGMAVPVNTWGTPPPATNRRALL
jgi:hypothetical protein